MVTLVYWKRDSDRDTAVRGISDGDTERGVGSDVDVDVRGNSVGNSDVRGDSDEKVFIYFCLTFISGSS